MYVLNKIVGSLLNPLALGMLLMLAGVVCGCLRPRFCRRVAVGFGVAALLWFWGWSTQVVMRMVALPLEMEFPVVKAEDAPVCDAIVVLGGGMGANTNVYPYAEMWGGADRVWHAARLYRAGKASVVIPSGQGECESTVPLLLDLGVPPEAIRVEPAARNTEENAAFVQDMLKGGESRPRVLLVTSAWHMRRSLLMYRRYAPGLDIYPAATDYEALVNDAPFSLVDLLPSYDRFMRNCVAFKEHVGYWGYRLFRR